MKTYLQYAPVLLLGCGLVCAQEPDPGVGSGGLVNEYMETGMEVTGVRAPYYAADGSLKAQLYGGHARVLEGGVADVTNIRIDVYEKGAVIMTVYAPQCFTRVVENEENKVLLVESEGDVLIEMEEMSIAGRGFRFASDSNRFEIHSEARVLVKEGARGIRELEP